MKNINPAPFWAEDFIFFQKFSMSEEKVDLRESTKNLVKGMALYSGASILGPIIIVGGIGYFLDKAFNGRHLILLASIFIAFVITNILIFRKARGISAELKKFTGNGQNGYNGYDEDEEEN